MKPQFLFLFAFLLIIGGCKTDSSPDPVSTEYLNVSDVDIPGGNTTATLSIQASQGCDWVVSSNETWITGINPTKGRGSQNVTLTVTVNPSSTSSRTGIVTVKNVSETIQRNITVTQTPNAEQLIIYPEEVKFAADGGSQEITITSNTHWEITGRTSWMTLSRESGDQNGTVLITIGKNTTIEELSATLTFTGNTVAKPLKVVQVGREIVPPTLSNLQIQEIEKDNVTISFSYTSLDPVYECGVCYSTSPSPTIEDYSISQTASRTNDDVTLKITGLSPETKYYVRAYARIRNLTEPGYSEVRNFTTAENEPGSNDNQTPNPIN